MPWENIGSVDTGELPDDLEWIELALAMALRYVRAVCGEPPTGCDLEIVRNDHDLGTYPTIGVYSEFEPPFDYVHQCERVLEVFNAAVDWPELKEEFYRAREGSEEP